MEAANDLTCRELVELVTEYLEGALPQSDQARFEEHLVLCPGCVYHLAQMRETVRLAGELTEDELPDATKETFLQAFRDWYRVEGSQAG